MDKRMSNKGFTLIEMCVVLMFCKFVVINTLQKTTYLYEC